MSKVAPAPLPARTAMSLRKPTVRRGDPKDGGKKDADLPPPAAIMENSDDTDDDDDGDESVTKSTFWPNLSLFGFGSSSSERPEPATESVVTETAMPNAVVVEVHSARTPRPPPGGPPKFAKKQQTTKKGSAANRPIPPSSPPPKDTSLVAEKDGDATAISIESMPGEVPVQDNGNVVAVPKQKKSSDWGMRTKVCVTLLLFALACGGAVVLHLKFNMFGLLRSVTPTPDTAKSTTPSADANAFPEFNGFPYTVPVGVATPLPKSMNSDLLLLVRVDGSTKEETTIARSYDGIEWEGVPPSPATIECNAAGATNAVFGNCNVTLSAEPQQPSSAFVSSHLYALQSAAANAKSTYRVDLISLVTNAGSTFDTPQAQWKVEGARLFLQGTFGPTRADIATFISRHVINVSGNVTLDMNRQAAARWIGEQMDLPMTSLRRHYRERTNPRAPIAVGSAPVYTPCDLNSRWRRNVLTQQFQGKKMIASAKEKTGVWTIRVDGALVSEPSSFNGVNWSSAVAADDTKNVITFRICSPVRENTGNYVTHRQQLTSTDVLCKSPKDNTVWKNVQFVTPLIDFQTPLANSTFELNSADIKLTPVPTKESHFIAEEYSASAQAACRAAVKQLSMSSGEIYLKVGSTYYAFDRRLKLIDNTVEKPNSVTMTSGQDSNVVCVSARRTFLNEGKCLRMPSCVPLTFSSKLIALDEVTLKRWYTSSSKSVHYIQGLTLTSPYNVSPCTSRVSRWKKLSGACNPGPTALDATTYALLQTNIRNAADRTNPYVRDIDFVDKSTCSVTQGTGISTIGALVEVDGVCWEHVHPDLYGVYDFTLWAAALHPGNQEAFNSGRVNPILAFGDAGRADVLFPGSHPLDRWKTYAKDKKWIPYVGARFGDQIDFRALDTSLQTAPMSQYFGIVANEAVADQAGFESCGSPEEVTNVPMKGHVYLFSEARSNSDLYPEMDETGYIWKHKQMVVMQNAVYAKDQLRHRVAYSLAQILTVGEDGVMRSYQMDMWVTFYDIFIRNAFGNYRDLLKEVVYSPLMGVYLTYQGNKAVALGSFPDENFAREIMQLFTIGLVKLSEDGEMLEKDGNPIPTYDNDDIATFAKIWTGFDFEVLRGNTEQYGGPKQSTNWVDPMQIKPVRRDVTPKMKLEKSGYIGDTYPVCSELPPAHFLRKGARYTYTGKMSLHGIAYDDPSHVMATQIGKRGRFSPNKSTSQLYARLCNRSPTTGLCQFPSTVVLDTNLPCDGQECEAEDIDVVQIIDGAAKVHFTYARPPCVRMSVMGHTDGKVATNSDYARIYKHCTDKTSATNGNVCCSATNNVSALSDFGNECLFCLERMTHATAERRCKAQGRELCSHNVNIYGWLTQFQRSCGYGQFFWVSESCSIQIQVDSNSGAISLYDKYAFDKKFALNTASQFRVLWKDGAFPQPNNYACKLAGVSGIACEVAAGNTCLCDYTLDVTTVFTDATRLPSVVVIEKVLFIGAPDPTSITVSASDLNKVYSVCNLDVCNAAKSRDGLIVHTKTTSSLQLTADVIFEIPLRQHHRGRKVFLYNKISTVHAGKKITGNVFSFRNGPTFMPYAGEFSTAREGSNDLFDLEEAELEVEDLLDHLVYHDNTPVFVAHKLIQRMVTSNPSSRYLKSVARAFKTGTYAPAKRQFSGKWGDLGATIAAILLDPEARSASVQMDPGNGKFREPLVKILHILRSMEFAMHPDKRLKELSLPLLHLKIGQELMNAPSVFGFYLPGYSPAGALGKKRLVAPEGQLNNAPYIVGFFNGMMSLINNGLTSCENGFGEASWNWPGRACGNLDLRRTTADGALSFVPSNTTDNKLPSASKVVEELDVLLTGGRLTERLKKAFEEEYNSISKSVSREAALQKVLKLFLFVPEFHVTNLSRETGTNRPKPKQFVSTGQAFKAVVVIFLDGGADTANLLIPHTCTTDMYGEYSTHRTNAAIAKASLLQISESSGKQPCSVFGLHPKMTGLKALYDAGDAAMIANVGALVEPLDSKTDVYSNKKKLPPGLYAHNIMVRSTHTVHAQSPTAPGVFGRMVNSLISRVDGPKYKCSQYSLMGNSKILEGSSVEPTMIDKSEGVRQFKEYAQLYPQIANISKANSQSAFAETYSSVLEETLAQTESMGAMLDNVKLDSTLPTSDLGQQLTQVAKLIKLRSNLTDERGFFITKLGGFDTHNKLDEVVGGLFDQIDKAMTAFVTEMKAQGMWDQITVVTVSDFGRTFTSNGLGTDHGWGGNHFVAGGAIRGKQVLGKFPTTLVQNSYLDLGRGRFVPTTAWEAVWKGIASWTGVTNEQMPYVLPNLAKFPADQLFALETLYKK